MRPYDFGTGKWVFIDWMGLDPGYGTPWGGAAGDGFCVPEGLVLKAPRVTVEPEPVLRPEYPWEDAMVGVYATVLDDEGLLRCWYEPSYLKEGRPEPSGVAYAESEDGVVWRKPKLGLTEFAGSKANNLVDLGTRGWAGGSVMKDPAAPAAERYKLVSCDWKERTLLGALSDDGLHWTWLEEPVLVGNNADTHSILHYNADLSSYVLYTRQRDGVMQRRGVNRSVSPVFGGFPPSEPVIESSPLDAPDVDTYSSGYSPWPGATHAHVMRLSVYSHTSDIVDVHLATSRDERLWHRPLGREPWLLPASAAHPRLETIYACAGVVPTAPGEWSTYVGALRKGHNYPQETYGSALPGEGLLRVPLREDGFMSLSAEGHGQCWTVPFRLEAVALAVNADVRYSGYVRCEVLEAGLGDTGEAVTIGRPLAGYTLDDCLPVTGNGVHTAFTWRGGPLAALRGRTVRLRLALYKADIYALHFDAQA
jgi:hypothetical protein